MMFLTVSISTMNLVRAGGVPKGTRWAKAYWGCLAKE